MIERHHLFALALAVGLHVAALYGLGMVQFNAAHTPDAPKAPEHIVLVDLSPQPEPPAAATPTPLQRVAPADARPHVTAPPLAPAADRPRAYMDAPPAPTAAEWALASTYTLKNSKRYRHTWGQQVRSMMGTAVEGADQGVVRFRIEIAPDGTLARLETLWSTSNKAEALARQAVQNMPKLPPTPSGQPLVFEKTISFQPFEDGGPPVYKDDCLPDPPGYSNPFAWDGQSPQIRREAQVPVEKPDPKALEECLKQLQPDSIEAETAHDRKQLEQWGSDKLRQTEVPRIAR